MKHLLLLAAVGGVALLAVFVADLRSASGGGQDMTLTIRWQRLVDDAGETCERCGATQEEVSQAVSTLERVLRPLGIEVALGEMALSTDEALQDIGESNRIWVADRPLEEWLGAEVGMSSCESCCSALGDDVECRTLTVDGNTYETVPAELIVKAGLLAGSQLIESPPPEACCPSTSEECCP